MPTFREVNPRFHPRDFEALYEETPEKLRKIFRENPVLNPNYFCVGGISPLMSYIIYPRKDSLECIQVLIDNGSDVNLVNDGGFTVLMYAVIYKELWCIPILLSNGGRIDDIFQGYSFMMTQENNSWQDNFYE